MHFCITYMLAFCDAVSFSAKQCFILKLFWTMSISFNTINYQKYELIFLTCRSNLSATLVTSHVSWLPMCGEPSSHTHITEQRDKTHFPSVHNTESINLCTLTHAQQVTCSSSALCSGIPLKFLQRLRLKGRTGWLLNLSRFLSMSVYNYSCIVVFTIIHKQYIIMYHVENTVKCCIR